MRSCSTLTLKTAARFDAENLLAQTAARQNAARMVDEVTRQTKQAIANVIQRSIAEGIPPAQSAKLIRPMIGLHSRQTNAVLNARAAWLKNGLPLSIVEEKVERYAAKLLRQRAMTIARTETMRAANLGQQIAWKQATAAGVLDPSETRRVWMANYNACPTCTSLDEQEAQMDSPFPGGYEPPAHPNCRCTTGLTFVKRTQPRTESTAA